MSTYVEHMAYMCGGTDDGCSYCRMNIERKPTPDGHGDQVNRPVHYTSHPSGVEVIRITEHMPFCTGNAIKYILRAPYKGKELEDLRKAIWYLNREIQRLEAK